MAVERKVHAFHGSADSFFELDIVDKPTSAGLGVVRLFTAASGASAMLGRMDHAKASDMLRRPGNALASEMLCRADYAKASEMLRRPRNAQSQRNAAPSGRLRPARCCADRATLWCGGALANSSNVKFRIEPKSSTIPIL